MSPAVEIQLIAVVTAIAAAVPGTYLVLRRMSLIADAVSHSILPGIVVVFFLVHDLSSPLLLVGAAVTGVLTVALIEALRGTRLVHEDAAIGLVFPALFSIGVILISRWASGVHLDTDVVLLGELAYAPFDRLLVGGHDLGPKGLWTMGTILLLNLAVFVAAAKEIRMTALDSGLAAVLGFAPAVVHYVVMGLVSVTAVGAFNVVGSILVLALMVAPPATAVLLSNRFDRVLLWAAAIAALSAVAGYWVAYLLDGSIAGAMAVTSGAVFGLAMLVAPGRGVIARIRQRHRQRRLFATQMLVVHLVHHESTPAEERETRSATLHAHLGWNREWLREVVRWGCAEGLVACDEEHVRLTDDGRQLAQRLLMGQLRGFTAAPQPVPSHAADVG
jgi:manganese/zinc/iron transport system permease protein